MSTFFLELENRIGICYSMKSVMKLNEKKAFIRFVFTYKEQMAFSLAVFIFNTRIE